MTLVQKRSLRSVRRRLPFQLTVTTQSDHDDDREGNTKDDHAPVYETLERDSIVGIHTHAAPICEVAATQRAHECGAEHAAISHTGDAAANEGYPEGLAETKFIH